MGWLWFFLGFAAGGFIGVCVACLAIAAGREVGRRAPEPKHHALDDDGGW